MDKKKIIETIAKEQRVEFLVRRIVKERNDEMPQPLKDLCQMIYLILLEYDEDKIVDLWEHGEMNFFIVRIIRNQYKSVNSKFFYLYRKFDNKAFFLPAGWDIADTDDKRLLKYTDDE